MPVSEARKRANKKWDSENKDRVRYLKQRSACRKFIQAATLADLREIQLLIDKRRIEAKE